MKLKELFRESKRRSEQLVIPKMQEFLYDQNMKEMNQGRRASDLRLRSEMKLTRKFIKQDLDAINERLNNPKKDKSFKWVYPSSLSQCPRYSVFNLLGIPDEVTEFDPAKVARMESIFHRGDEIGLRLCVNLERMGVLTEREFSVRFPEYHISGRGDGRGVIDGQKIVYEFKSINSRGWKELEDTASPKEAHDAQIQSYLMKYTDHIGVIIYEHKDQQTWKEFVREPDKDVQKLVINSAKKTLKDYREGNIPDRISENRYAPPCRWCSKQAFCFNDIQVEKLQESLEGTVRK